MRVSRDIHLLVLGLSLLLSLEAYDQSSLVRVDTVFDALSLSSPARIEASGTVSNLHYSGSSLVFVLVNNGRLTCYWRHPTQTHFLVNGDFVFVRARLEFSREGKLCVVEEVSWHDFA